LGLEVFREMLNRDPGEFIRNEQDRLGSRQVASQVNETDPAERVLLVRMDGSYYIQTVDEAAIAATSDPDFVTAIPLAKLRMLINRSVQ
jgi:hypothetical protein